MRASERRFCGSGLPGVDPTNLSGKLVVVEGADGSGRSTQIAMLKEWLEGEGFATVNVGLARSNLVSQQLEDAKLGNVLGRTTLSLFYATDFADQLENRILTGMSAGFIVLADRYIYTLMIRDLVRGADPAWLTELYGIAIVPDLVFYLKMPPRQLVLRNFRKNEELDFWESGMDIGLSRDRFDSFVRYQNIMQRQFAGMADTYAFHVINGDRSVASINRQLRNGIAEMLRHDGDFESVPDPAKYHPRTYP